MTGGPGAPPIGAERNFSEDTVELELSAAEQLALSQAADATLGPPQAAPDSPGYDTFVYARTRRADLVGTITFAALVCGVTAVLAWRTLSGGPDTRAAASTAPAEPAAAVRVQLPAAVVQLPNPFDATEVFELPADTSEAEARDVIAELLLQRARERREQGLHVRRVSTHHPHAITPVKPSDVFITKLILPANRFADTPGARNEMSE